MLEFFYVSFNDAKSKLGTLTVEFLNLEKIMKVIRYYLKEKQISELDIKIKKIRIVLDKSEDKIPEIEVSEINMEAF